MKIEIKEIGRINNDCPEHGESKKALDKFWSHPWTSHWGCKCEKPKIDTKYEQYKPF